MLTMFTVVGLWLIWISARVGSFLASATLWSRTLSRAALGPRSARATSGWGTRSVRQPPCQAHPRQTPPYMSRLCERRSLGWPAQLRSSKVCEELQSKVFATEQGVLERLNKKIYLKVITNQGIKLAACVGVTKQDMCSSKVCMNKEDRCAV